MLVGSRNDVAHALSSFVAGDVDCLGAIDLPVHQALLGHNDIELVHATSASKADPFGPMPSPNPAVLARSIGEAINGGVKSRAPPLVTFWSAKALNIQMTAIRHLPVTQVGFLWQAERRCEPRSAPRSCLQTTMAYHLRNIVRVPENGTRWSARIAVIGNDPNLAQYL